MPLFQVQESDLSRTLPWVKVSRNFTDVAQARAFIRRRRLANARIVDVNAPTRIVLELRGGSPVPQPRLAETAPKEPYQPFNFPRCGWDVRP